MGVQGRPDKSPLTSGVVTVDGVQLGYDEHGDGADVVVLLPALVTSRRVQTPLARSLALRDIRVICLDFIGERVGGGAPEPWRFSSERLGAQVVGALRELGTGRLVDPASAANCPQGLFFGRMGPPREQRSAIATPTLVIGYRFDPLHPMADARALAEALPDARLVRTNSMLDLRVRPERLAGEIARFVGDCRRKAQVQAPSLAA